MNNNAVAVMGYPDKLNKHRLSTNRKSFVNLSNNKSKEKAKTVVFLKLFTACAS